MKAESNEQLLELIGEALRDGPGTPAWERALAEVDAGDGEELQSLYRARERLESGKRWRQVRPGIGFTRKVMDAIDHQSDAKVRPTGPATIIAILCGILVLAVLVALLPRLFSPAKAPVPPSGDEFQHVYFATPWVQSTFDNALGGEWRATDNVAIHAEHGLHAIDTGNWGIVSTQSLPGDGYFSFDAKLDMPADGSSARVFVTDQKKELSAVITADHVQVQLPGGETVLSDSRPAGNAIDIKWLIGPASAALEINGQRAWAGANNLAGGQARFIGARFSSAKRQSTAAIREIEVRTKR